MLTIVKKPNSENAEEVINIDSAQFKQQLKTRWDEIYSQPDVFRYKINNLRERKIDNKYILLLNKDRGSKRRTPEYIDNVHQPFDPEKFHFNKASYKEILFKVMKSADGMYESDKLVPIHLLATLRNNVCLILATNYKQGIDTDTHTFLVNVSPISRYHTLLCPSANKCLPQVVTEESLKLAMEVMFLMQDRDLKLGFNSLCAFASVNHLHYHMVFDKNTWLVETAKCKHLKGPVYITEVNPVPAFCFEVTKETIVQATKDIFRLIEHLLSKSIGHNILLIIGESIIPGSESCEVVRVLVTPRKTTAGIKQLTAFNVGVYELSGLFPVFNPDYFDVLKTEDLENELIKWALPNFEELYDEIKSIL